MLARTALLTPQFLHPSALAQQKFHPPALAGGLGGSLLCALLFTVQCAFAQWGTPTVDTVRFGQHTKTLSRQSIAISPSGNLHVVWVEELVDGMDRRVYYSMRENFGAWSVPVPLSGSSISASSAEIALDSVTGAVYVAYDNGQHIAVRSIDGADTAVIFASVPASYFSAALTVDAQGLWHAASIHYDEAQDRYSLYYANGENGGQVVSEGNPGVAGFNAKPSIAVEPEGTVHIAYCGGSLEEFHAHDLSAVSPWDNWTDRIVLTENAFDFSVDVAVYAASCPVWAVSGNNGPGSPDRVNLNYCLNHYEPISLLSEFGQSDPVFVMDPNGQPPHVVCSEVHHGNFTGRLVSIDWDWDYWRTEPMFGPAASSPSIVMDAQGFGHVICMQHDSSGNSAILHLTSQFPIWLAAEPAHPPLPTNIPLTVFPNPFNPATEISFDLPTSSEVMLTVFDVRGRLVETLVDAHLQTGSHHVRFDASDLSSGIYFCRLETQHQHLTRKLLLVK